MFEQMLSSIERLYNNRIDSINQVRRLTPCSIGVPVQADVMTSGNRDGEEKEKPSQATALNAEKVS
ncbi:hypothetical protein F506_14990 [Herbaspirillum hiltneri N3]|uniref:Uncharacterized protein n=1 Tax=Herbaspirillum hiltneri N3 TaxID=1262470 RepID=A0ABM5V341_9BURK|nr:hypothetical protein [Herbaspirillum hiltneri]AKZ63794.1 hypothetical protein F506_14990 [Herbaspirillum hiltneri N3]